MIMVKHDGIDDIRSAVDKLYEVKDYEEMLNLAFTKGFKPPKKLSDHEKKQLAVLLKKSEMAMLKEQKRKSLAPLGRILQKLQTESPNSKYDSRGSLKVVKTNSLLVKQTQKMNDNFDASMRNILDQASQAGKNGVVTEVTDE